MTPVADSTVPANLAIVPIDDIHPSPLQPRTAISTDLVAKLAESMRAGRHEPLIEVEPEPGQPGHYRIVCGEQRWRAAKAAGIDRVLVRVHERLGSLQRLQKQYEENRLRADLTAYEDAQLLLLAKELRDIEMAEQKLTHSHVNFEPLEKTGLTELAQVHRHLEALKALLLENGINVIKGANGPALAPLTRWEETERTLGISEATRKLKLSVLRLEPDVLNDVAAMPAWHASLIARVEGSERRAELAGEAAHLTHRQLHAAVSRLRKDPSLSVAEAVVGDRRRKSKNPLGAEMLLVRLGDLCRQLVRLLAILQRAASDEERLQIKRALNELIAAASQFENASTQ